MQRDRGRIEGRLLWQLARDPPEGKARDLRADAKYLLSSAGTQANNLAAS